MPTILTNGSKRVGFSPHNTYEPTAPQFLRSFIDAGKTCPRSNKQTPNRYRSSPARLLRHIKANVSRTFSLFSSTKRRHPCSRNGPSDPIPIQFIPPRDSHHSEALEDCIEFINSSHRKSL